VTAQGVTRRAIVIFPRAEDMHSVEAVRLQYDPLAREVPAHITLVFPFESEITEVDLKRHVENVVTGLRPFEVAFGQVVATPDHYLFLTFTEGAATVADLHDRLYSGPLRQFLLVATPFVPHITVGRVDDPAALPEALKATGEISMRGATTADAVSAYRIDEHQRMIEFKVPLV
jgi:2'-5' RNA ligase